MKYRRMSSNSPVTFEDIEFPQVASRGGEAFAMRCGSGARDGSHRAIEIVAAGVGLCSVDDVDRWRPHQHRRNT